MLKNIKGAFSLWNLVRGTATRELQRAAALPVSLLIIADESLYNELTDRLGGANHCTRIDRGATFPEGVEGQIIIDGDRLHITTDSDFDAALSKIAVRHADRRIALAAAVPAFRKPVVNLLSQERAYENAKFAAISALPGVIPLTDWLLPATAVGDLYVLTKNQILLLLEVAACYGKPPDIKARLQELLPVVGSAFGWRAVARELIGLVPGGVGVVVKAGVAYVGTYSVGKGASLYYSGLLKRQ